MAETAVVSGVARLKLVDIKTFSLIVIYIFLTVLGEDIMPPPEEKYTTNVNEQKE